LPSHGWASATDVTASATLTTLETAYGQVRAYLHGVPGSPAGAIMVGGIGNDVEGPRGSYLGIAAALASHGYASLRLSYGRVGDLMHSVEDVLGALNWCARHGMGPAVLVGWSFGGAVVITAGAGHAGVAGVATVATQGYDASQVQAVSPRSLLLVHGTADPVLPAVVSKRLYQAARQPKQLVLLDGAGHDIAGHERDFERLVVDWALPLLGRRA
jgi:alpha/beta superfamily hydrolase